MHLDRLSLTNFKCFLQASLQLSKLTVLLGANSAGKTSLLHGIIAALQSDLFPLSLSPNGILVNLGDFRAISHCRQPDLSVGISLEFGDDSLGAFAFAGTFARSPASGMPELHTAEIKDQAFSAKIARAENYRVDWTYDRDKDTTVSEYRKSADTKRFLDAIMNFIQEVQPKSDTKKWVSPFSLPPQTSGKFTFSKPPQFFQKLPRLGDFLMSQHVMQLSSAIRNFRNSFNYIGSFRLEPLRSYYQISKADLRVKRNGENYIEQIVAWQEQRAPQLQGLSKALSQLHLLSRLRTEKLGGGLFQVKARTTATSVSVSLPDVGFGIGQVLPILVADLQLPKGSTLAVSQPEIHLHPSVQADLADHFTNRSLSGKNRYIIETHSEYFLNRLRLLVAQEKISESDISVVYLSNDGKKSALHELRLLPNGRIEGAPEDFFRTYMIDVMNIALNAKA